MPTLHDGWVSAEEPAFESLQGRKTSGAARGDRYRERYGYWPSGRADDHLAPGRTIDELTALAQLEERVAMLRPDGPFERSPAVTHTASKL